MDLSSWPKANFNSTLFNSKNVVEKIPPIIKCTPRIGFLKEYGSIASIFNLSLFLNVCDLLQI